MFRTILMLIALLGASGFSTVKRVGSKSMVLNSKSKSVPFSPARKNLAGIPSDSDFDPVGFSDFIDIRFLREAEIKHGRVAMLGFLGFVATEFVKLPGDIHNVGPIEAHNVAVGSGAMAQILALVTLIEAISIPATQATLMGEREPGNFGFDPMGLSKKLSPKDKDLMQYKEIKNGRLAMLAFAGVVTQAALTGKAFPYF